jgi:hypothetical protein
MYGAAPGDAPRSTSMSTSRALAAEPRQPVHRRRTAVRSRASFTCFVHVLRPRTSSTYFVHVLRSRTSFTYFDPCFRSRSFDPCFRHLLRSPASITCMPALRSLRRAHLVRRNIACAVTGLSTCFPKGRRRDRRAHPDSVRGLCLCGWYGRDPEPRCEPCDARVHEDSTVSSARHLCAPSHRRPHFRKLSGDRALCDGVITAVQASSCSPEWRCDLRRGAGSGDVIRMVCGKACSWCGPTRRLGTRTNRSCPGHSHAIPWQCVQRSATQMDAPSYRACSCCFEIDCCGW